MRICRWGLAAAALLLAGASAQAKDACFSLEDWHGWQAASADTLYLDVRVHDVYRLVLVNKEPLLTAPNMHLTNEVLGPTEVCGPQDLNLRVADGFGTVAPIFVKSITKLTPEEIKALPKDARP